jgi:hypothetical protein
MPKLSGNKGEWSEIYVFLRLLETGRLCAADADLNKIDDVFYNIINIIRDEKIGVLEFRVNRNTNQVSIYNTETEKVLLELSTVEFANVADKLYREIVAAKTPSFFSVDAENFLDKISVNTLKAKSNDKADIRIKIHDINTGYEAVQGFSIKSRLGSPSTLINAGKTTNFIYEVVGPMTDDIMIEYNTRFKTFQGKFGVLHMHGCDIEYRAMENETFNNNLRLLDGDLPEICAELLKIYYWLSIPVVEAALKHISIKNPLDYPLAKGHPFYSYKFKKLLTESALGMLPSKVWNGTADATGGYIIVREDGEVLCYHLFNRNEFENYLIKNTKFETASTSRHQFGEIYKEDGKYYLKLNLQVRFIK